jgi:hypothetical protein
MKKGAVIFILLFCASLAYAADSNVTACGTIASSGTHTLTQNITSTTDCITITSSDVIIDCAGNTIFFNTGGGNTDFGVTVSSQSNISVHNCIITDTTDAGTGSFGVDFNGVTGGSIDNNTIFTDGATSVHAVYLRTGTSGINVTDNTLSGEATATSIMPVYVLGSTNYIANNTISVLATSGGSNFGIYEAGVTDHNTYENNHVTVTATGSASNIYGYYCSSGTTSARVLNNTFNLNGAPSTTAEGVRFFSFSVPTINNSATDNRIFLNTSTGSSPPIGIFLLNVANSTIARNSIYGIGSVEARGFIVLNSSFTMAMDNSISLGSSSKAGMRIGSGSHSGTYSGTVISGTSLWINVSDVSSNATFNNLTLNGSASSLQYIGPVTITGLFSLTNSTAYATSNVTFHNSTAVPEFNTSARITMRNLGLTYYQAIVDYEDDGTFVNCGPPQCVPVSASPAEFVFDVLGFTTYSATDGTPPVPEFSTIALFAILGLVMGGFVVMRRR